MIVEIPGLKLESEANAHAHHWLRVKRARAHHDAVSLHLRPRRAPAPPAVVTITRLAPTSLDSDNLQGSAKHVRDAIAAWLGVDDRDPRITWHVAQEKTKRGVYAVRLAVRAWDPAIVGARIVPDGPLRRVEVVLGADHLRALGASLLAAADGARPASRITFPGDGVEIVLAPRAGGPTR